MDALPPSPPPSPSISLPPTSISSLDPSLNSLSKSPTFSTSRPLPLLPTELKREILRFCDPSTLAKTSSLSLAFLQLSSPLLYDEIEITGLEALAELFCPRDSSHQPQLEPYLSLTKIRSLAITALLAAPPLPHLSSDRIPSTASAVDVDTLTLRHPRNSASSYKYWETLLPLVSPRSARFIGASRSPPPYVDLRNATWRNLSLLSIDNGVGIYIKDWPCLRGQGTDINITFVLPSDPDSAKDVQVHSFTKSEMTRVKKIVLRSSSEKRNVLAEKKLMVYWAELGITGEDLARRKGLFAYEVVSEVDA